MRPFDRAWRLLKSFDATQRLPRRAKQMSFAGKDAEDIGMQAADSISREAEFHAQQEALREMGIHGAGLGFKNQPAGSYAPKAPVPRASFFNALDPQNNYTMQDHYARYPDLSDEELEQMAAESERIHREEMQREYMDDLERRIDAGEVTPTDIFDEGGNAAADEGYMSGGRQY